MTYLRAFSWSVVASAIALSAACGDDTSSGGAGGSTGGTGAGTNNGGATNTGGSNNGGSTNNGGSGGGAPAPTATCPASDLPAPPTDCSAGDVLCVGPGAEFTTIQDAADASKPGDTVLVAAGSYAGFQIDVSGTADQPITFAASGAVTIDSPAPTGDGIRIENSSHVRVIGFAIHDTPERCIAARGATPDTPMTDVWVVSNTCDRAGVEGFYLSELESSHVELNVIRDSGQSGSTRSHGIYLANAGSDNTTICGNLIAGSAPDESNGIHFNGDLSVGGDGVISGLIVASNVVTGHAQNGFNLDGVQDSTFVNNVVYGNVRNALRAYAIDAAEGPRNLVVVGNTLLTGTSGWPLRFTEDLGGHVVFDNILLTEGADLGSISLEPSPAFASSHNVVVDRFTNDDESSIISLAEWQALGYDDGSIVSSPAALFTSPGTGDFTLLSSAPAIDAGVASFQSIAAPNADIAGTPRPSGAGFDIGAYERAQ
ncbi:MAG: right-handed parallel beta-helix repeat-containing protein [Polyangiaceae bacterium]